MSHRGKRRKVTVATYVPTSGLRGIVRWTLALECGHEVNTTGSSAKRVPTVGHCWRCECAEVSP
jgi:hypothetical protein